MSKSFLIGIGICVILASRTMAMNSVENRSSEVPSSTGSQRSSTDVWHPLLNNAFQVGESLLFVVRWGLVTGGYSTLSVSGMEIVNNRPAYHINSEAHTIGLVDTFYHVSDHNEAWLDAGSLMTVRYGKNIHEGKYRVEESVVLDQERHHYKDHSYRLDKNTYEDKEGSLPPHVMDVFGSMYYVRALPLAVGQSYTMDVYNGDKVWPLIIKVEKREKISVPAGKFDCFLVEPLLREPGIFISKGKKLQVWMTADARHLPVRMRSEVFIGHVSAELVDEHHRDAAGQEPSLTPSVVKPQ